MKKLALLLGAIIICTSCDEKDSPMNKNFLGIEGISFENYPKVDGSTSARALNQMIAYKLLGVRYEWVEPVEMLAFYEWQVSPNEEDVPDQYRNFFSEHIKTSRTNGAFMNLIDGNADIILTHRTISPDEKAHADAAGITLIETPIALDAFVFVVNKNNPVKSLTVEQIQKIYTGEITNWQQVGGKDADMNALARTRNSGSEEVFRILVMDGLEPADFPINPIPVMTQVVDEVVRDEDAICYTFNNYKDMIVRVPDNVMPKIAINGIFPDDNMVKNRTYPFVSEVYVAIRSDLNPSSMAYKLYEWLQTDDVKSIITECGFIPK